MSFSERIRRPTLVSERRVRVGDGSSGGRIEIDLRPQSVQEAEERHRRHLAALERQHQAAREQAYRDGYNDGAAVARDAASAELDRTARFANELVATLAGTRAEWFAAYEKQIVELVCRALEEILADRPPLAGTITRALGDAFACLGDVDRVAVRCHPKDLALIRGEESSASVNLPGSIQVRWLPDEEIGPGGCVLETTLGVIDARVEQQLAILRGALWDAVQPADSTERTTARKPDPERGITARAETTE
ncbi:MAG: FliH/SctL family protein [Candidatus Zixiibacteriota bacterium]